MSKPGTRSQTNTGPSQNSSVTTASASTAAVNRSGPRWTPPEWHADIGGLVLDDGLVGS